MTTSSAGKVSWSSNPQRLQIDCIKATRMSKSATKMTSTIAARNLLFQLAEEDLAEESLKSAVDRFAIDRGIDSVLITTDGKLLFSGKQRVILSSGVCSLQRVIGLRHTPERVEVYNRLPDNFIMNYFRHGYDETKVYHSFGDRFTQSRIDFVLQQYAERKSIRMKNRHLLSMDTINLVADGRVSVIDAARVEESKKLLNRKMRELYCNPDLDGTLTLRFEKWVTRQAAARPVKAGGPTKEVTLVGLPGEIYTKRKHYVIYSKEPGFGKTYELYRLSHMFNMHFVNDVENWFDVPSSAQFLVFDEVGYVHNKMDFENLKALTGGMPVAFTGKSFIPRKDVQVILLSSRSPYDIYGIWDRKLGKRVMSKERLAQFHERFEVHRLDGSVDDDRLQHSPPDAWSQCDFFRECKRILEKMYVTLTDFDERTVEENMLQMVSAIDTIASIGRQRESDYAVIAEFLSQLDGGRFSPSLEEVFHACYDTTLAKRKNPAMFNRLVLRASEAYFVGLQIEQVMAYIVLNPTSVNALFRYYTRYIDFNDEDKERVYRACLSVHSVTPGNESPKYRTLVFEPVWNIARVSSRKRKAVD